MAGITKEETQARIYDYAWNYVNVCAGQKSAAYMRMLESHNPEAEPRDKSASYQFHEKHREEIERLITQFREENRAKYPHMRDSNIAILTDIAVNSNRNADRISAIKELNSIFGYNSQNLNINGKVDSEIEINITNL